MKPDAIAKRVALWAGAFVTVTVALGILGKWAVADPILRSQEKVIFMLREERSARIEADARIIEKISEIADRQALFVGAAITPPGSLQRKWADEYLRDNALRVK